MEKKFIMLEIPNNIKEEKRILGIINQAPYEVHNYRECLSQMQSIAARINEIRKSITHGYTLTLHLTNGNFQNNDNISEFETITDFAKWYINEYSPRLIEVELEERAKRDSLDSNKKR